MALLPVPSAAAAGLHFSYPSVYSICFSSHQLIYRARLPFFQWIRSVTMQKWSTTHITRRLMTWKYFLHTLHYCQWTCVVPSSLDVNLPNLKTKNQLSPCCAIILCLEWMMEWFYFGCVSDASEIAQENKDVSSAWSALNNHQAKVLPPKIFLGWHFLGQTKLGSWHLIVGASGLQSGVMPQKTLLAYLYYDFKTKTHSY